MMVITEDHTALAAEYALGTLDADERAQIELTMAANREFAALIEAWQLRLAVLHQMVAPVEPPQELWERIRVAAGLAPASAAVSNAAATTAIASGAVAVPVAAPITIAPGAGHHGADKISADEHHGTDKHGTDLAAPIVIAPAAHLETAKSAVAASHMAAAIAGPAAPAVEDQDPPPLAPAQPGTGAQLSPESMRVVRFAYKARLWKWTATGTSAIAASLLAIIVAQLYQPDLLPNAMRPAIRTQVVRVVTPPPPVSAQFVALLQQDAASPAFILTVDAGSKKFTVRRVGATDEPGRSYELWLVSDKLQRPRSLGVIGERDFTSRAALASFDDDTMHKATYAVTIEPEGGSPTGIATGPVVFTGKLMETVPPAPAGK